MKRLKLGGTVVPFLSALMLAAAGAAVSVKIATIGVFALAGATTHISSQMVASGLGSPLSWDLAFTEAHAGARIPISDYDVEMTKPMHLIVVNDAFTSFAHLHPSLDASGTFHLRMQFPKNGYYHLYADTTPHGNSQQVFRFDFIAGSLDSRPPPRNLGAAAAGKALVSAGPYQVAFTIPPLLAGNASAIAAHVTKDGAAASDLAPYLGAAAHVVMLNARDLSYIHVHPMLGGDAMKMDDMSNMKMDGESGQAKAGPDMMVHVTPKSPGTYKLWLQFANSSGAIYIAPIVIAVK